MEELSQKPQEDMDGYIQLPQEDISIITESGIYHYDRDKNKVTGNIDQYIDHYDYLDGPGQSGMLVSGKPLYIETEDLEKLEKFKQQKTEKEEKEKQEKQEKVKLKNVTTLTRVQNYINTKITHNSAIISEKNKNILLDKIQESVKTSNTKLDSIESDIDNISMLQILCKELNNEMIKSYLHLFSSFIDVVLFSALIDMEYGSIEIDNSDITIKKKTKILYNDDNKYSLKIKVPNIIFFYNFTGNLEEALSLLSLDLNTEYEITTNGIILTINTIPPITTRITNQPNKPHAFFIYKMEGMEGMEGMAGMAGPPKTCIGSLCKRFFPSRVHTIGGKRTRKQKYSARSRGIITLRKKRGPSGPKCPKSRRKIERLTSFRNKR